MSALCAHFSRGREKCRLAHGCRSGVQKTFGPSLGRPRANDHAAGQTHRAVANKARKTQPKLSGHKAPASARLPRPCSSASYQTGRHQTRPSWNSCLGSLLLGFLKFKRTLKALFRFQPSGISLAYSTTIVNGTKGPLPRLLHPCNGLRQTRLSDFPRTSAATMRISASTRTPKLETSLVRVLALCGACPVKIDPHHHLLQR
jgi:hypothetical protein